MNTSRGSRSFSAESDLPRPSGSPKFGEVVWQPDHGAVSERLKESHWKK